MSFKHDDPHHREEVKEGEEQSVDFDVLKGLQELRFD